MSDVGIRIRGINFISYVKEFIVIIIKSIIVVTGLGLTVLFLFKVGNRDINQLLVMFIVTGLWLFIYYVLLTNEKDFIVYKVELDNSGNINFKYNNSIVKFNIMQEYSKNNIKVKDYTDGILVILKNFRNTYSIELYFTGEYYNKVLSLCMTSNIKVYSEEE